MRTAPRRTAALLALAAAVGCVLPDQISRLEQDVADLRQQVGELERAQREALRQVAAIEDQATPDGETATREDLAELTARVDRVAREAAVGAERLDDVDARLERLAQETRQAQDLARSGARSGAAPPPPVPAPGDSGAPLRPLPPPSSPGGAQPDPEALYNTAYLDFSKGNFDLAVSGFEEYQERFAQSPLADNALYWIGECYFSRGDFPAAIRAFDRLLESYQTSDKAAAADLKKALAFQEQNQIGQAIVQLRYVLQRYPDTDEASIARDKLAALGQAPS